MERKKNPPCRLLNTCITYTEQIPRNGRISNEKQSGRFKQNWALQNIKYCLCICLETWQKMKLSLISNILHSDDHFPKSCMTFVNLSTSISATLAALFKAHGGVEMKYMAQLHDFFYPYAQEYNFLLSCSSERIKKNE